LRDVDWHRKIILKWIINKYGFTMLSGLIWLQIVTSDCIAVVIAVLQNCVT